MGAFNEVEVQINGTQDYASTLAEYNTVVLKPNIIDYRNVLTQAMMSKKRTKYVIRWNYELEGAEITVPKDCLIEFDGGSFANGTLVGQDTILIYNQDFDVVVKDTCNLEGTFIYKTTVADEEDITSENGLLKFKNRPATDGMGKVILRKNKSFASQVTKPNTIYVIQYDFTLGEDITIPENCILEFDGGSISGEHTITGQNTGIYTNTEKIFDSSIVFSGVWSVKEVVANWFIASNDTSMFQKACDFANTIANNAVGNAPTFCVVTVICKTKKYNIDNTIFIDANVSFDGNGSVFIPTTNLHGKYMFSCNSRNISTWDVSYPNNDRCHIGNFAADGANSEHGAMLIYCVDSRRIHDIKLWFFSKAITYGGYYIDNRRIERVLEGYPTTPIDYTSIDTELSSASVSIGEGDNVSIVNCTFTVALLNLPNVHLDNYMGFIAAKECSTITITNAHTEGRPLLHVVGNCVVNVSGYYAWAVEGQPVIKAEPYYANYPVINLENCYILKLSNLKENYHTYKPISGYGVYTFKNVFGTLSTSPDFEVDRGGGLAVALPHPFESGKYISGVFAISNKTPVYSFGSTWGIAKFSAQNTGTDFYARISYLCPNTFMCFEQYTLGFAGTENTMRCISDNCIFNKMCDFIFRIEFSSDGISYTHYFDFMAVNDRSPYIKVTKTQDGYEVCNIPAKSIDYLQNHYVRVDKVKAFNRLIEAYLTSEQSQSGLPTYVNSYIEPGSKLITSEGVTLVRNSNESLRPEGHLTGPTANRPTLLLKAGVEYFDTNLGKPIYYNGTAWVDATGTPV